MLTFTVTVCYNISLIVLQKCYPDCYFQKSFSFRLRAQVCLNVEVNTFPSPRSLPITGVTHKMVTVKQAVLLGQCHKLQLSRERAIDLPAAHRSCCWNFNVYSFLINYLQCVLTEFGRTSNPPHNKQHSPGVSTLSRDSWSAL